LADPIKKTVAALNEALELDADAITQLINMRVDCNKALAGHALIQVQDYVRSPGKDSGGQGSAKTHRIGVLGLINGAIGTSPTGDIGAEGSLDGKTGNFTRVKRFVDLREEKLDVLA